MIGQTNNDAIIVACIDDLDKIDFNKSIYIYSQTTKSPDAYKKVTLEIKKRIEESGNKSTLKYIVNDTLCRQVSGREPQLINFSKKMMLLFLLVVKNLLMEKCYINHVKK